MTVQAPVIPAGQHLHYWDSADEANALVSMRGMELQNHWGPVNANATLPPERLSALFGTVATYYSPPKPQVPSVFLCLLSPVNASVYAQRCLDSGLLFMGIKSRRWHGICRIAWSMFGLPTSGCDSLPLAA